MEGSSLSGGSASQFVADSGIKSDVKGNNLDVAWEESARLKSEGGEHRRRRSLADKDSDRSEGLKQSMHFDINKGLKQITHDSDVDVDVETDSNDSGCLHVIVNSDRWARTKNLISESKVVRVGIDGSEGSSNSGDGFSSSYKVAGDLLEDGTGINGFEEEKDVTSKVCPVEDVVQMLKMEIDELEVNYVKAVEEIERLKASPLHDDYVMKLNREIRELDVKYLKAMEEIESRLKASPLYDDHLIKLKTEIHELEFKYLEAMEEMESRLKASPLLDDTLMQLELSVGRTEEKFNNLETQIKEIEDRKNHMLSQTIPSQQLVHKLHLHKPFVRGILLGLGMGLILFFLYTMIRCMDQERRQIPKIDIISETVDELEQVLLDFESAVITDVENRIGSLDLSWQKGMDRCRYYELSRIDSAFSLAVEEMKSLLSTRAEQLRSMANLQCKLNGQLLNFAFTCVFVIEILKHAIG